ncbi:hypothetical protein PS1_032577 [Malus domestica]
MFSKQGKSSFCHLFYPCINSTKGTRAPKARTCDHPGLAKGTKEGKPKEVLWFHAFRCRLKWQLSHAIHDY